MSTHTVIAFGESLYDYEGVYCHWDGNPGSMGAWLWETIKTRGTEETKQAIMSRSYWSTLVNWDLNLNKVLNSSTQRIIHNKILKEFDHDVKAYHVLEDFATYANEGEPYASPVERPYIHWFYLVSEKENLLRIYPCRNGDPDLLRVIIVDFDLIPDWDSMERENNI